MILFGEPYKNKTRKAFTLIVLLVVIAIIAILAAILFPVFASAKEAAKASADLSNIKQIGTSAQIYVTDYDDVFPQTAVNYAGTWQTNLLYATPANWVTTNVVIQNLYNCHWSNSLQPYIKNRDMMVSQGGTDRLIAGAPYTTSTIARFKNRYQMNGLLNSLNATVVAAPSQLPIAGHLRESTAMQRRTRFCSVRRVLHRACGSRRPRPA